MSNFFDIWIIGTYSAIHKTAGRRQEQPQRLFPYSRLQGFSGIVPGKAGNGSAGGFVNSAVRGPANSSMAIYSKSKIGYVEPWNDQRVTFQKLPNRSYEMSKGPLCPNLTKNSKRKCPKLSIEMCRV